MKKVVALFVIVIGLCGFSPRTRTILSANAFNNGPCDIAASAGTPCIAAHSVTRRMWSGYAGPLFQIRRASDSTTKNIRFTISGAVDQSAINSFCGGTSCFYSIIYDQMHTAASGNNLPQATAGNQAPVRYTTFSSGRSLPMVATGAYQYYRNRASTVGMPTGNSSITEYDVINTFNYAFCCGTYGNMESTIADNGGGHMFALTFGNALAGGTPGTGSGPWPGADWENGVYLYGSAPTSIMLSQFSKYNSGTTKWTVKSDTGLTGALTTLLSNGTPPYTAAFEGGISLGEGGDGSPAATGFFEGVVLAAASSDGTDNAIAANVSKFYSGFGQATAPQQNFPISLGSASGGSGTQTMHPSLPVPAGSLIVIQTFDLSSTPLSNTIGDTKNTYTLIGCEAQGGGAFGTNGNICAYYAYNVTALTTSDTITFTSASPIFQVMQGMYSSGALASANPLDSAVTVKTGSGSGLPTATTGVPAQSGELFIGWASSGGGANPTTQGIGWNTVLLGYYGVGWVTPTTATAQTYAPTGGSGAWAEIIVGFKHK